ncbi:MAG: radical SAM protein, partial [Candidatus Aenigmatarchaeota archaeon]
MSNGSKETLLYEKLGEGKVRCDVCPRHCVIDKGEKGFCRVRENREGVLYSLVYGKAVSSSVDPIEKKPFFHFAPGSRALSVATVGCNLRCDFCQNARIATQWTEIRGTQKEPEDLAEEKVRRDCQGIAYTYTEPTVFLEYALDTMKESEDGYNVFVSNGYMTRETAKELRPYLDAINVDLKGSKEFYKKHCEVPDPEPIYEALKELNKGDVHI